jgi:regulator of protease activity HflC (stomatin/prohibitin superfamily)
MSWIPIAVGAVTVVLAACNVRILREYERAVVFRLGRLLPPRGPGIIALIPFVDRMVRVDTRIVTLTIPPQEVISRDNIPVRVNAVAYFRVVEPIRAVTAVERYAVATSQIAQTTLRSVLGRADLDTLLADREQLNESLRKIIDEHTEPWGVKVIVVEIKDVEIPEAMQRAIGRQAEAERERRAKVINSRGEVEAATNFRDAAGILAEQPSSIQLRYLQTLLDLGSEQRTTVVFPLPMDLVRPLLDMAERTGGPRSPADR